MAQPTQRDIDGLAAALRRQEAQIAALQAQIAAGTGGASGDAILRGATGLPALPGSIWSWLAKMAWADRELLYANVMEFRVNLVGALDGAGNPADGPAQNPQAPPKVTAGMYFVCNRLSAIVERDPTNPNEDESSMYVDVQVEDDARQAPLAREVINLREIAGTRTVPGIPMQFDDTPLAWWPDCQLRATFYPRAGFPDAGIVSSITNHAYRIVILQFHGVNVKAPLIDNLIAENRLALVNGRLLVPRERRAR